MRRGVRLFITAFKQGILFFLCFGSLNLMAEEIKKFTFTDVDSELVFRYLNDEQIFYNLDRKTQQDKRPTFQEEYIINTNSYVFHPNFLTMELGASVLFDQSTYETLEDKNTNNEALLGYNARLDFLDKKPYPVTIYYDKRNPSVSVGLAGRFLQENIKYGAEMALMQPVLPFQVTLTAYRQSIKGEGIDQITDDMLEHADIRLYRAYGKGNHAQLTYQIDNRDSRSGNPDLPISSRTTSTTSAYLDAKNKLGNQYQGELITIASYNTQAEFPRRKELRINPMINWQHSDQLRSFYRLNYNNTNEEELDIEQTYVIGGMGYSALHFEGSMDVHGEDNQSTTLDYKNLGANYAASHDRPITIGVLKLSYNGSVDYRDQKSTNNLFEIYGEEHEMLGTTPVTLARDFIETTTINIWNTSRTQLYIEGLDYRLLDVGSQTQVQRLTGGSIISGQIVLIDYSYNTGGTFAYDVVSNNFQLSWSPSKFYEMYIRYLNSQQNLREGEVTNIQLNSLTSRSYGIRADQPLENGINLGGELYLEERDEDINPFTRESLDAYVEFPLPRMTSLRMSTRRVIVDNQNSVEDVDLTGYILRLQTQPWLRARLSFESSYENDTGGTIDRTLKIQRVQFGWAFRQLKVTADAHYSTEQQGVNDRDRWAAKIIMSRMF